MKFRKLLVLGLLTLGLLSCAPNTIEKESTIQTTKIYKNTPIFKTIEDDVITSDTIYWYVSCELGGKGKGHNNGVFLIYGGTDRLAYFFILKSTKDYFSIDDAINYIDKRFDDYNYRGITFFKQVDRRCYLEWKNSKTY